MLDVDAAPSGATGDFVPADLLMTRTAERLLDPILRDRRRQNEITGPIRAEKQTHILRNIAVETAYRVDVMRAQLLSRLSSPLALSCIARGQLRSRKRPVLSASDVGALAAISQDDPELAAWVTLASELHATPEGQAALHTYLASPLAASPRPDRSDAVGVESAPTEKVGGDPANEESSLVLEALADLAQLPAAVAALHADLTTLGQRVDRTNPTDALSAIDRRLTRLETRFTHAEERLAAMADRQKSMQERLDRAAQRIQKMERWSDGVEDRLVTRAEVRDLGGDISNLSRLTFEIGSRVQSGEDHFQELAAMISLFAMGSGRSVAGQADTESSVEVQPEAVSVAEKASAPALPMGLADVLAPIAERAAAQTPEISAEERFRHHTEAVATLATLLPEALPESPDYAYVDGHNTIVEPMKGGFLGGDHAKTRAWIVDTFGELMTLTGLARGWMAFDTSQEQNTGIADHPGLEVCYNRNFGAGDGADEYISQAVRARSPRDIGIVYTSDDRHIRPAIDEAREDGYDVRVVDARLLFCSLVVLDTALQNSDLPRADALEQLSFELADQPRADLRDVDLVGLLGFNHPAVKALNEHRARRRKNHPFSKRATLYDDPRLRAAAGLLARGDTERALEAIDRVEFGNSGSWDARPLRAVAHIVDGDLAEAARILDWLEQDATLAPDLRFDTRCLCSLVKVLQGTQEPTSAAEVIAWMRDLALTTYSWTSSTLRVLRLALQAADALNPPLSVALDNIQEIVAPQHRPSTMDEIETLRAAGAALARGDWTEAEVEYARINPTVHPRHRSLNEAMVAIGLRHYGEAQETVKEFEIHARSENLRVLYEVVDYLARVGSGDEATMAGLRTAVREAYGFRWAKAPVRFLVTGIIKSEQGEILEAAQRVEKMMATE